MLSESLLTVRVSPRASRNRHEIQEDGTVHLWLTAPPVDGAANKAVIAYLADLLDCPGSSLKIVLGQSSRTKRIQVPLSAEVIQEKLEQSIKKGV